MAIARALANEPRVLLADEPTGNLDVDSAHHVMRRFSDVRAEGMTILLVTHDLQLAALADRMIRIEAGRIVSGARPVSQGHEAVRIEPDRRAV